MTNLQELDLGDRRIWLRAFYGFDPEGAGYIGFTNPGDQAKMLDRMQDGDLVLIYGAVENLTQKDLRAQALGFLEIETIPCKDQDRMSAESVRWKLEHDFEDRWTNGIIVRRAWRVTNRVGIKTIAPKAYDNRNRFERTSRAILLGSEERNRALSHHVRQTNVFGEEPINTDHSPTGQLASLLKPSRGIPPTYGSREHHHDDGENLVYLMIFRGVPSILLGPSYSPSLCLAKVGRSNNPTRRLKEINCGFPISELVGWQVIQTHRFTDGATAHDYEDALKAAFDSSFESLGGEFFVGRRSELELRFHRVCTEESAVILGAPAQAKGVR